MTDLKLPSAMAELRTDLGKIVADSNQVAGTALSVVFLVFLTTFIIQNVNNRFAIMGNGQEGMANIASAVENVKAAHENGWKTGSTGWKYKYSTQEAERLILRGHGTFLSARTLLSKNLRIPSKHFSIARVYRPEVIDKTHLSEFNQVEGIVIDEKLNLKDLLGVLGKFAMEIAGADKVRFKPDYFPFTEPSVELSAYKEGYGWVEFGGQEFSDQKLPCHWA